MKRIAASVILLLWLSPAFASHITGGELMYEYVGAGGAINSARYKIILRLFRDCYSTGPQLEGEQVRVGIYLNSTLSSVVALPLTGPVSTISLGTNSTACLTGMPRVCYQIANFSTTVELPVILGDYTLVTSSCCRIGGISNLIGSQGVGAAYTTKIPGMSTVGSGANNSPTFLIKDTALVCSNKSFILPFTAFDINGDSLSYSFCPVYGSFTTGNQLPNNLNFTNVNYALPYTGLQPLGPNVTINPNTGIISGRAPNTGKYAVAVCATEYRNGIKINEHRKDFILSVQDCDYVSAELQTPRVVCNSFAVGFENISYSNLQMQYYWDFGVSGTNTDVSTSPTPVYTYPDTGVYRVKLKVTGLNGCIDSAESTVSLYPGFTPNFNSYGSCITNPVNFTDATAFTYGELNKWQWDFGNPAVASDTSSERNPSYKYAVTGSYPVKLIVHSTKGCIDTVTKTIAVREKPELGLPFKDTLTCGADSIQIHATGIGNFTWTPSENLSGGNTASPTFFPTDTTTYYVTMNEFGCIAKDSIRINLLRKIGLTVSPDTSVCSGDLVLLTTNSQAAEYKWTPSLYLNATNNSSVLSKPLNDVTYQVVGKLGKCSAQDSVAIKTNPYPVAYAGRDTSICMGSTLTLNGEITGNTFKWTPANSMLNAASLTPTVAPAKTTAYLLTTSNNTGCIKPVSDTVVVQVTPPVYAFAGNDTAVVTGQALQLQATGGTGYTWSPAFGLSNPNIANPVATISADVDIIKYKVLVSISPECKSEDEITIRVFKTGPELFVPSAFTPNGDGKNDILKPILAGIKKLDFFKIFNRWGQMMFSTSEHNKGWNGTLSGKDEQSGTYIYHLQAQDHTGKVITKKGTIVLLR